MGSYAEANLNDIEIQLRGLNESLEKIAELLETLVNQSIEKKKNIK
jgi:hypothetical protein